MKTNKAGKISIWFILVCLLFTGAIFLFSYIADEMVLEKEAGFDTAVFSFLHQHATPALVRAAHTITFFGSQSFLLPAYIILIALFFLQRKFAMGIDILLVGASSTLLMVGLKHLFRRQRPDHPIFSALTSYSFPSGHALSSFIFCSVLVYIVWNSRWAHAYKWLLCVVLVLFALAIGISRIILRYHYPSDVLAGVVLGFVWALTSLWLLKKLRHRTPGTPDQPEQS